MGSVLTNLTCPFCCAGLNAAAGALHCPKCPRWFEVRGGIPCLVSGDPYRADVPRERVQRLVEETREIGWRQAFERLTPELPCQEEWSDLPSERRAGWWPLLALRPDWRVLNIGCNCWGFLSYALAHRVSHLVACDVTLERLRLLQMRAASEGVTNIQLVRAGDTPRLPFPDGQFDAAILDETLEWAATCRSGDPEDVQKDLLREVARVLKPQGQLLLAMENRFNWHYFQGKPEEHTGLKYISLLPRPLANLYAKSRTGQTYRNRTYSYWGSRRVLRQTGFHSAEILAPLSDHRFFEFLADPTRPGTVVSFLAERRPEGKLRLRLWLEGAMAPLFTPSFATVAHRGSRQPSVLEDLAAEIAARLGGAAGERPRWQRYWMTRWDVILATFEPASGPGFVVRLPPNDRAQRRCEVEHEALRSLHATLPAALRQRVPVPLEAGEFRGIPYFVQTLLAGYPAFPFLKTGQDRGWQTEAADFLVGLHSAQRTEVWLGAAEWQAEMRPQIGEGLRLVEERLGIEAARVEGYLQERLGDRRWPLVLAHGDYWAGNLLLDKKGARLLGVIDWDRSRPRSFPLLDLINGLLAARVVRERQRVPDLVGEIVGQGRLREADLRLIEAYLEPMGLSLSTGQLRACFLLYWLSYVTVQARERRDSLDDQAWCGRFVLPAEAWLKELLARASTGPATGEPSPSPMAQAI